MSTQMSVTDLRDAGAFIHSELDDYGLDPFEFRVYARIVRRAGGGRCFESIPNIAKACQMSLSRARNAIKLLVSAGLIIRNEVLGFASEIQLTGSKFWAPRERLAELRNRITKPTPVKSSTPIKNDTPIKSGTTPPTKNDRGTPIKNDRGPLSDLVDEVYPYKEIPFNESLKGNYPPISPPATSAIRDCPLAGENSGTGFSEEAVQAHHRPSPVQISDQRSPQSQLTLVGESSAATPRQKSKKSELYETVREVYNANKPMVWCECRSIDQERRRLIDRAYQEHGQEMLQMMATALENAGKDTRFWGVKPLKINTLFTKSHLVELCELDSTPAPSGLTQAQQDQLERRKTKLEFLASFQQSHA